MMFNFLMKFLQRGFHATFSYHSWQSTARMFQRLTDVSLLTIFTLLAVSFIL